MLLQEQGPAYDGLTWHVQVRKLKLKGLSLHYGRLESIVLCIRFTGECLCCSVNLRTTLCSLQHAMQFFIDTGHLKLQNIPFSLVVRLTIFGCQWACKLSSNCDDAAV